MIPLFGVMLPLLVLFCGLSLDVGLLEFKKLQMQNAADSAAIAAQRAHDEENTTWVTQGQDDAALNGFTNGSGTTAVSVSEQPNYGDYSGDYDAIQVTISQSVPTIFMGALHGGKVTMTASSVSLMTPCVYLTNAAGLTTYSLHLQSSASSGASIGYWGGSTMGCPLYASKGIVVDNYSSLWTNAENVAASSVNSTIVNAFHAPRFNAASVSDPLASTITAPTFSSCTYTSKTVSGTTATLSPGTYCKGLNISSSTVTLSPGLYIIAGGASWQSSTISGTGVTLYFTQSGDGNFGQFIVNNSTLSLSAPTTSSNSSIPAILVMSDRSWVHTAAQDFQFLNSSITGDGIYYTTGSGIEISVTPMSATHYLAFDTDNLLINLSAICPLSNFSAIPSGNPFRPLGGLVQ